MAISAAEKPRRNGGNSLGRVSKMQSSMAMYGAMPASHHKDCSRTLQSQCTLAVKPIHIPNRYKGRCGSAGAGSDPQGKAMEISGPQYGCGWKIIGTPNKEGPRPRKKAPYEPSWKRVLTTPGTDLVVGSTAILSRSVSNG